MTFWSRLRQSKLKFHLFPSVYKRCYTLNHSTILANQHIRSHTINRVLDNPDFIVQGRQLEFRNVRFYAKPAQAYQKKEDRDPSRIKVNEEITAPTVRLVTDEGHYVISRYEAMARAKSLEMDLVEVDKQAKPPVCKILDYHKQKYIQQTKEKERAKSKDTLKTGGCKEIRFAAKINQKDLQMKADLAKRLMENCHRVKCTAIHPTDDCDLATLLSRFRALIKDFAIEESAPKVEKKQAFVVARHVKFGPAKSGSAKKASKSKNQQSEENGSETEHVDSGEMSDEDVRIKKSEWSVFDEDNDDINTVFDINEENGQPKSPVLEQPAVVTGNRYARDPTAGKPSRNPTDINGRGAMNRTNIPSSPTKSFGVYSVPQVNTTPNGQSRPAESNRYKKNGPSDSGRNPTATDSRMNRGPGAGNPREGRW